MKEFVRLHKRAILLGLAAALVVAASIGGTLAWLTSTPSGLTNTFVPGEVPNKVVEEFHDGGSVKENVKIQNIGNVPAYIRVALVPVWRNNDTDHTGTGLATDTTYDIDFGDNLGTGSNQWTYNSADGFYYYNNQVQPGEETDTDNLTAALIDSCAPKTTGLADAYIGKVFELNVIAQSIQAEGMGTDVDTALEAFQYVQTHPVT